MYSVYKYNNGATAANVLADVVAILTGTTDVQTLSASCDKANSSIFSTVSSGWEVHDAAAGTNAVVLKAPVYDAPAQYKYMLLSTNTAGYFSNSLYETWNATAHTGTNMCYLDSTVNYHQRVNYAYGSGGFLYISATARHALFHSQSSGGTLGQAGGGNIYQGSSWPPEYQYYMHNCGAATGISGCVEYTRWSPWDTPAAGYLPALSVNLCGGGCNIAWNYVRQYVEATRIRSFNGTDLTATGANAGGTLGCPIPGFADQAGTTSMQKFAPPNNKITNAAGAYITPMLPITAGNLSVGWFGGNISEQCNIWYLPSTLGYMGDEITVSGQQYIIWAIPGQLTQRMAIFKG